MSKDLHAKKKCESSCDSVNVYIPPLVIYIYTVYFKVTALDLSYHIPLLVRICLQCVYCPYMSYADMYTAQIGQLMTLRPRQQTVKFTFLVDINAPI